MSSPSRRVVLPPDILLVEDNIDSRELLHGFLLDEGFHVDVAGNGAEALVRLSMALPRMILLDLVMPVMNGWELHERLRADPLLRTVPVVVISGTREAGPPGGIQGFLPKPINLQHLRLLVRQFCGRRPEHAASGHLRALPPLPSAH